MNKIDDFEGFPEKMPDSEQTGECGYDLSRWFNKHYITIDEENRIVDGFSDAFRQPSDTDICINDKGGYQFRLPYSIGFIGDNEFPTTVISEENPALYYWPHMIPLYKWGNGVAIRRTEEEIEADIAAIPVPAPPLTTEERLSAIEDALCEMDAANAASIAALEDALCEIDAGGM